VQLKYGSIHDENWRILIVENDERIKTEQPDLVVLDLMLPGEDSLAVCRLVRPHTRALF
jgi:two-component system response regulator RstA